MLYMGYPYIFAKILINMRVNDNKYIYIYTNNKVKGAINNDTSTLFTEVQKQKQPNNRI